MIEVKRAMTGPTLKLNNAQQTPDPKKPFDLIDQFLGKDLDYTPQDEVEGGRYGSRLYHALLNLQRAKSPGRTLQKW